MRWLLRTLISRRGKGESGFTLVELLVVVGIIVALAAVIIPNVANFSGKGEEGARAAELDTVQTSMDAMMADLGLSAITANQGALVTAVSDFTGTPTEGPLTTYLRDNPTTYAYCWDATGLVTGETPGGVGLNPGDLCG